MQTECDILAENDHPFILPLPFGARFGSSKGFGELHSFAGLQTSSSGFSHVFEPFVPRTLRLFRYMVAVFETKTCVSMLTEILAGGTQR